MMIQNHKLPTKFEFPDLPGFPGERPQVHEGARIPLALAQAKEATLPLQSLVHPALHEAHVLQLAMVAFTHWPPSQTSELGQHFNPHD